MDIVDILLCCSLPGAAGGLSLFLWGCKKRHYRNNMHIRKFLNEVLGAVVTATFLAISLNQWRYQIPTAFIIGICWSRIVHRVRAKVDRIVDAVLGDKPKGGVD